MKYKKLTKKYVDTLFDSGESFFATFSGCYIPDRLKDYKDKKTYLWDSKVLSNTIEKGDIFEFGVFKGATITWFAKYFNDCKIYGFDSFYGNPENRDIGFQVIPKGEFTTKGKVPDIKGVEFIKGLYSETVKEWFSTYNGVVKVVHMDCNLYSSAATVLGNIKPFLRAGSIILFDEIYYKQVDDIRRKGEYQAFIDFLENNPDIEFKVLGKTVRAHVAIQITKIGNSDYFDIAKPITRQLI